MTALDLFLFEEDMCINTCKHSIKRQHIIFSYAAVIASDWGKKMQPRTIYEFLFNSTGWETFICNYDTFPDIVITDKSRIRACVNAIARKYFRADRFHKFDIIGIQEQTHHGIP